MQDRLLRARTAEHAARGETRQRRRARPWPRQLLALATMCLMIVGPMAAVAPVSADARELRTPVMGTAALSEAQVLAWFRSVSRPEFRTEVDEATLVRLFREEGEAQGVDWNVAFTQAILETAWFNFPDTGQVRPEDNNFGGMGAFDGADGRYVYRFPDARTGVRAKFQHLRIYGDAQVASDGSNLGAPIAVDVEARYPTRWLLIRNGSDAAGQPYHASATAWQDMGNGRWATDPFYNCKVLNIYRRMLAFHGEPVAGLPTNPTCLFTWHQRLSNTGGAADSFAFLGRDEHRFLTCDFNGDGRDTPATFLDGRWYVSNLPNGGSPMSFVYGQAGDIPLCGDWDGDGRAGVAIVRDGTWHLRDSLSSGIADRRFTYGRVTAGDIPVVGDWDGLPGDGVGIIRDGVWHLRDTLSGGPAELRFRYGRILAGDRPVVGDWSGDGRDGVGIVRNQEWHLRSTLSGGPAQLRFWYGQTGSSDVPVAGDWNGDGRSTPGIVRR